MSRPNKVYWDSPADLMSAIMHGRPGFDDRMGLLTQVEQRRREKLERLAYAYGGTLTGTTPDAVIIDEVSDVDWIKILAVDDPRPDTALVTIWRMAK